jgi:hypothetical protein
MFNHLKSSALYIHLYLYTYYRRSGEPIPLTKTLNSPPQLLKFLTPKPFDSVCLNDLWPPKLCTAPHRIILQPIVYAIWRPDSDLIIDGITPKYVNTIGCIYV